MLILLLLFFNLISASEYPHRTADSRLQSFLNGLLHLMADNDAMLARHNANRLYVHGIEVDAEGIAVGAPNHQDDDTDRQYDDMLREYGSLNPEGASQFRTAFIGELNQGVLPVIRDMSRDQLRAFMPTIQDLIRSNARRSLNLVYENAPPINHNELDGDELDDLLNGIRLDWDSMPSQINPAPLYQGTPIRRGQLAVESPASEPLSADENLDINAWLLMNRAMNIFATPPQQQGQILNQLQLEEPLAPNEDLEIPRVAGVVARVLATPPQQQAPRRRLLQGSPLLVPVPQQIVERLVSPQGVQAPLPQTGAVHPRDETAAEQREQEQGRRVRRRLNFGSPMPQLQFHPRDDENGPDGGGLPA